MKKSVMILIAFLLSVAVTFCAAAGQTEALVELSCGKVEYLNYRCTLPDGRLLVTGGTRRNKYEGDAAWIMCLNRDRTVSWEYISRKDGYVSAEEAVVLADGTIAVVMENYPKKRAAMFFTPNGKKTRKKLDLMNLSGTIYTVTPSFIMTYDSISKKADDYRHETILYDWKGREITRYDGLIMKGGYGFIAQSPDDCVFYGHDQVLNGHAMIQKLNSSSDQVLWETILDWQLPGTDTAAFTSVVKTGDDGYIAWLREGRPGKAERSFYDYHDLLVKLDAEGRLLWLKDKEDYGQEAGLLFPYDGNIGILCEDSHRIDASRYIRWLDHDGKRLGTTTIQLNPDDFTVLRDYLKPETAEEKRTTIVDQQQFIPMEDGLWVMATCFVAKDLGEGRFSTIYDSQEIVMYKIPGT